MDIKRANLVFHDETSREYDKKWAIRYDDDMAGFVLSKFELGLGGSFPDAERIMEIGCGTGYAMLNLGLSGGGLEVGDGVVAFTALEDEGDLNGDGDQRDAVLHVYDVATNTTINLGLDAQEIQLDGRILAFSVGEFWQGGADLNGDADALDDIVHVADLAVALPANLTAELITGVADLNLPNGPRNSLTSKLLEKGFTLVPVKLYIKDSIAKVEVALAKGKRQYDKRESIIRRETEREIGRAIKKQRFERG